MSELCGGRGGIVPGRVVDPVVESSIPFCAETETLDELTGYRLRIVQPRHGYRFSVDPLLLVDFARLREGDRVADLGTGCGVIPLLVARSEPAARVTGIELQEGMAALARRNVEANGLADRIDIVDGDVISLKERFAVSSFDLVLSNPPYRRPGTGKVSPRAGRDLARHETTATLADFLSAAKFLVKENGRICFIYHTSRLPEVMVEAARQKLAVLRLRMVYGTAKMAARMFLVELMKGRAGELQVEPPLFVRGEDGGYSEEKLRIYRKETAIERG